MIRGIKDYQEADLVALFHDFPGYIGPPEAGEVLFNRNYGGGLSLTLFLDVHGGKAHVGIACAEQSVVSFPAPCRIATTPSSILLYWEDRMIAELMTEPYPCLNLNSGAMPDRG